MRKEYWLSSNLFLYLYKIITNTENGILFCLLPFSLLNIAAYIIKPANMKIATFIFSCIFFIISHIAYSQKNIIHQNLVWFNYVNTLKLSNKSSLVTDIQERVFTKPEFSQHQFLFRPTFYRSIGNNWDAGAGLSLFLHDPQFFPVTARLTVPEIRPNIDLIYRQKTNGGLSLTHRYRFEARFFHNVKNNELDGGFLFTNFRFRYLLNAEYPVLKDKENKPVLKAKMFDEIHFNFGKKVVSNSFDQNRLYAGLVWEVSAPVSLELGYLHIFQELPTGKDYFSRNIIRFAVNHRIDISKH